MTARSGTRVFAACLLSVAWTQAGEAASRRPLPFDLEVEADYRGRTGPLRRLEDVSRAVVGEIGARGCYRSVRLGAELAPGALRLRVTLDEVEEETVYDVSLAEREGAHNPDNALKFTGVVEVRATVEIFGPGGERPPLASRRFHVEQRMRPWTAGEDVIESAWRRVAEEIARTARRAACRLEPSALGLTAR